MEVLLTVCCDLLEYFADLTSWSLTFVDFSFAVSVVVVVVVVDAAFAVFVLDLAVDISTHT